MTTTAQSRIAFTPRTAVLVSTDAAFRERLHRALSELRWQVRETAGGAETLACLEASPAEAVVLDSWLPDLEIREFVAEFHRAHPEVDLIMADASDAAGSEVRGPRRNEILHALRRAQATDDAIWKTAPVDAFSPVSPAAMPAGSRTEPPTAIENGAQPVVKGSALAEAAAGLVLQEFIGAHPAMVEVSRRIRLVAPRSTPVLIEGPTGSGKELVARAVHRLSPRATKRMVALNCAAIPEGLLEAELFGHTRGAFTGAVENRTGRIEAAHGGTLFLDEIGEMPLGLQAKLLRFLETGEVQRVGNNESIRVDARIVAATHRPLARLAAEGGFRADLFYRLSVFLIRTPPLAGREGDIERLTGHFLEKMGRTSPAKQITAAALQRLVAHGWPGNVRELEHVLERAWILAEDRSQIDREEIEFDGLDEEILMPGAKAWVPVCGSGREGMSEGRPCRL
jgi:DNA-binding NtrC family response regulator